MKFFGLSFGWKNQQEFWFEIPYTKERLKIFGDTNSSQNQRSKWILKLFLKPKL